MAQQTEMFIRIVKAGTEPMGPNEHGLFNVNQVAVLVDKRGCLIEEADDYGIEIKGSVRNGERFDRWTYVTITATAAGLWHPSNIFRACREAAKQKHYEVQILNKLENPRNLNEFLIAQIIGADGVKPYLLRHTEHFVCHYEQIADFWQGPANTLLKQHIRAKYPEGFGQIKVKAAPGDWTWPMLGVMCQRRDAGSSSDYKKALYALSEAGLIDLKMGGRQGIGTATFEWLPGAYLAVVEHKETFHHDDSQFFCDLMAVSG
jgi:hypothetical protein